MFLNKKVLITGHTGFKGSWMSLILMTFGAKIIGYSISVPNKNCLYNYIKDIFYRDYRGNILNKKKIELILSKEKPDYIFHFAAQPIVSESYKDPLNTFAVNSLGSLNLLDAVRNTLSRAVVVMITSDKVYKNNEWVWGYRENDQLGGIDPYSASKAMTEIGINSYIKSFFKNSNVCVTTVRAGNVIGGGDWSANRIVPDTIKSTIKNRKVLLRSPKSIRPWQHVFEPLSGYINLSLKMKKLKLNNESFNFGPDPSLTYTVENVVKKMSEYWSQIKWKSNNQNLNQMHESQLLSLDYSKAYNILKWTPKLNFDENIKYTVDWYKEFNENKKNIKNFSIGQINKYFKNYEC